MLFEQDIIAPEDKPITVTFRAHLPKGRPSIDVINNVPGLSNNFRSGRHGNKPFVSTKDGRIPWQMKLTDEQGRPRYPFLILDSIAIRGPFITDEEQRRRDEYWPQRRGKPGASPRGPAETGATRVSAPCHDRRNWKATSTSLRPNSRLAKSSPTR